MSNDAALLDVLKAHARRYPLMEPQDAVKLIYQNEFGGGHLISDPKMSLEWIEREFGETTRELSESLLEDIGNGIVRVNFHALDPKTLPLDMLNEVFVRSAELHQGSMDRFLEKLAVLEERFEEIGFTFSADELTEYLSRYRAAGCPMVSHSESYRTAYSPAYRVVLKELINKKITPRD